jgi:dienelactone hydrolase
LTTTLTLPLVDADRGRTLTTTVQLPREADEPRPLIVFGHGFDGHPRKFTKLLGAWADAGYVVAAPTFPLTNDEFAGETDRDDVVNQPADISFVIDELLRAGELDRIVDEARIGVAGFSLGGMTALAVGFHPRHRDERPRAIAALAGRFLDRLGGTYEMGSRPLLVVHGTDDALVPYQLGEEVYREASPPKVLVTLEGARHHEEIEDGSGPLPAVVETTLAFWDLFLRDDESARERLLTDRSGTGIASAGL